MSADTEIKVCSLPGHPLTSVILAMACAGLGHAPRSRGIDILEDRLDTLGLIMGDYDRPSPRRVSRREIAFIDTPKPVSKRRARRLRGKAAA